MGKWNELDEKVIPRANQKGPAAKISQVAHL